MNSPELTTPIPLLLSEQLDIPWIEERAAEIANWQESPYKQWIMASHNIDWAIAEGSYKRMEEGFASLHELTVDPEYHITSPVYRGAKMIVAYERAFRQRLDSNPIGRKTMNVTYRNWAAVGQEIGNAEFTVEPGRPLSSLSEVILLGVHMRAKDPHNFPFLSLPREEKFEKGTFVNHDGYLLKTSKGGGLTKEAWEVVSHKGKKFGTHPEVREVSVLEVVSGVLKTFPEAARALRSSKDHLAVKLAQLRFIAGLLEKEASGHLSGVDLQILNNVTGGFKAFMKGRPHKTTTRGGTSGESDMARQLRAKFGSIGS